MSDIRHLALAEGIVVCRRDIWDCRRKLIEALIVAHHCDDANTIAHIERMLDRLGSIETMLYAPIDKLAGTLANAEPRGSA
jgi:hypothetical protein